MHGPTNPEFLNIQYLAFEFLTFIVYSFSLWT